MNLGRIADWVQILTGIALVVGIFLVLEELEQNKRFTQAQMISESTDQGLQRTLSILGENPMAAMAKACDPREKLSREDALVLNHLFTAYMMTVMRAYEVDKVGGFATDRWKRIARGNLISIFTTQHGRDWWRNYSEFSQIEPIVKYGNEILESVGSLTCSPGSTTILEADVKKRSAI